MGKNRKRTMLMSLIVLVLCLTMLIGTTFAWFTDNVASGKNKIQAGKLDVEVYHTNASITTGEKIDNKTNLFLGSTGSAMNWEPGAISYETFEVKNVGDLALKYTFKLNVADKNTLTTDSVAHDLTEVIKVAIVVDGVNDNFDRTAAEALTYTTLADFQKVGNLSASGSDKYSVVLYWAPTDNDNLYNVNNGATVDTSTLGVTSADVDNHLFIDFGINVLATQDTVESDSFDNQYDAQAGQQILTGADTQKVVSGQETVYTVNGTPLDDDHATTVTFPADSVSEGKKEVSVTSTAILVANTESAFNISADTGAVAAIELTMTDKNGNKVTNFSSAVEVETYIAKNLTNVTLKYIGTGDEPTDVTYDSTTGKLTFKTTHFSTFAIGADEAIYVSETNTAYKTLEEVIGWSENGCAKDQSYHIYLLKDVDLTKYPAGTQSSTPHYFDLTDDTLDLNGYKITTNNYSVSYFADGNGCTIKNGTFEVANNGSYAIFLSSSTGTIRIDGVTTVGGINVHTCDDVVISSTNNDTSVTGTDYYAIWAESKSNVTINGGTFTSQNEVVCLTSNILCQVTINGGTFETTGTEILNKGGSEIYVQGGSFNKNLGSFVELPFKTIDNGNDTYSVVPATCWKVDYSESGYEAIPDFDTFSAMNQADCYYISTYENKGSYVSCADNTIKVFKNGTTASGYYNMVISIPDWYDCDFYKATDAEEKTQYFETEELANEFSESHADSVVTKVN